MSETEFKYIPKVDIKQLQEELLKNKSEALQDKTILMEISHQLKRIADKLS